MRAVMRSRSIKLATRSYRACAKLIQIFMKSLIKIRSPKPFNPISVAQSLLLRTNMIAERTSEVMSLSIGSSRLPSGSTPLIYSSIVDWLIYYPALELGTKTEHSATQSTPTTAPPSLASLYASNTVYPNPPTTAKCAPYNTSNVPFQVHYP